MRLFDTDAFSRSRSVCIVPPAIPSSTSIHCWRSQSTISLMKMLASESAKQLCQFDIPIVVDSSRKPRCNLITIESVVKQCCHKRPVQMSLITRQNMLNGGSVVPTHRVSQNWSSVVPNRIPEPIIGPGPNCITVVESSNSWRNQPTT